MENKNFIIVREQPGFYYIFYDNQELLLNSLFNNKHIDSLDIKNNYIFIYFLKQYLTDAILYFNSETKKLDFFQKKCTLSNVYDNYVVFIDKKFNLKVLDCTNNTVKNLIIPKTIIEKGRHIQIKKGYKRFVIGIAGDFNMSYLFIFNNLEDNIRDIEPVYKCSLKCNLIQHIQYILTEDFLNGKTDKFIAFRKQDDNNLKINFYIYDINKPNNLFEINYSYKDNSIAGLLTFSFNTEETYFSIHEKTKCIIQHDVKNKKLKIYDIYNTNKTFYEIVDIRNDLKEEQISLLCYTCGRDKIFYVGKDTNVYMYDFSDKKHELIYNLKDLFQNQNKHVFDNRDLINICWNYIQNKINYYFTFNNKTKEYILNFDNGIRYNFKGVWNVNHEQNLFLTYNDKTVKLIKINNYKIETIFEVNGVCDYNLIHVFNNQNSPIEKYYYFVFEDKIYVVDKNNLTVAFTINMSIKQLNTIISNEYKGNNKVLKNTKHFSDICLINDNLILMKYDKIAIIYNIHEKKVKLVNIIFDILSLGQNSNLLFLVNGDDKYLVYDKNCNVVAQLKKKLMNFDFVDLLNFSTEYDIYKLSLKLEKMIDKVNKVLVDCKSENKIKDHVERFKI